MSNNDERYYPLARVTGASPEYGIDANSIKTKIFDLGIARDNVAYEFGGNVLWAVTSSNPTALINIRLNDQLRDPLPVQIGLFMKGIQFSRMYVSNAAQPGQTITILYCVEEFNNINIQNPAGVVSTTDLTKPTQFESLADLVLVAGAAAVVVLPANAVRRSALLGNLAGNLRTFRVGDDATAAARGAEVGPGESIIIDTTDAIYAYNPGAGNESISRIWTED